MEREKTLQVNLSSAEFTRLANNFYNAKGLDSYQSRINIDAELLNYFLANLDKVKQKYKVAFVWVCLNPPYWEFAHAMIQGAKQFFLPGHDVDYFVWSDMPDNETEINKRITEHLQRVNAPAGQEESIKNVSKGLAELYKMDNVKFFPTEGVEWPMPTLMRYHLFLQQEEVLKDYDYIFYCDVDMQFVDVVGDEILSDGLTSGTNPMYYLDKSMWPPYEPNPNSTAYINRPGRIINDNGQKRFQPLYYAGGFQGGKADKFIAAMKVMRERIDQDMVNGYIAIWNEESHWNKYLSENPPSVVLNPSYIYPDTLHKEYYEPRWGRAYQPKLVTLTKKFSTRPLTAEEQKQLTMMKQ